MVVLNIILAFYLVLGLVAKLILIIKVALYGDRYKGCIYTVS